MEHFILSGILSEERSMKLLKSIITRLKPAIRGAFLVGTVLWLSVAFAPSAYAAYINYEISSGLNFSAGTFSWDQDLPESTNGAFSTWDFTPTFPHLNITPITFPIISDNNNGAILHSGRIEASNLAGDENFSFRTFPDGTYSLSLEFSAFDFRDQRGTYTVAGTVPEPAAAVLLATGLLFLAGLRWLPRRGEQQQLG